MDRWLLVHVPTWALFVVFGVLLEVGVVLLLRAYRRRMHPARGNHNEILAVVLSLVVGVYGVLLGFVIVTLWTSFEGAETTVSKEATALAQLARTARSTFDPAEQRVVDDAIRRYVRDLEGTQFPAMERGETPNSGELAAVYDAVARIAPPGDDVRVAAYDEMQSTLSALTEQNRARTEEADGTVPGALKVLVLLGAAATLSCLFLFSLDSALVHGFVLVVVTEVLGQALLLALILEYPFLGSVHAGAGSYGTGILRMIAQ
ncbi:Protein of unknown function [Jatrophihabitans endophyticus]|uniref:DUF4239 domain-containing protein n=1 Tax=Jatrophihabitans endophyticus TaxID=1206085 RepID=A0A1M5TZV5_9ACTN|nr:DUF4239 domain-containing protein [Jatrophihabitans endophyticus]SHH56146.1 Protein of unknown function [Jatrophihabitans endophyticus]